MKTRKLLLSALFTLGIVLSIGHVNLARDLQKVDDPFVKNFAKHRDKSYDEIYNDDFIDEIDSQEIQVRGHRNARSVGNANNQDELRRMYMKAIKPRTKGGIAARNKTKKPQNATIAAGVCRSVDVRNFIQNFQLLRGCQTIEGYLQILLLDNTNETDYQNLSFPELREVTEYMLIYHIKDLKTFKTLFPNLEVIRGDSLLTDYALIIYEVEQLDEIGFNKLTQISRGGVRIEYNRALCYANTVDWNAIVVAGEVYLKNNGDEFICREKKCPANCPGNHCWTSTECQKTTKRTCHHQCLDDCFGSTENDCYVCKYFRHEGKCVESCPPDLFDYRSRRCVTENECLAMPSPRTAHKIEKDKKWRTVNRQCLYECPQGYKEEFRGNLPICVSCGNAGKCVKNVSGAIVRHISDLQHFKGATVIDGALEIAIRNSHPNVMKEFTDAFSQLEEITYFLKVSHSFPLTSLEFFKNLRIIKGEKVDINNASVVIVDNPNLAKLFPPSQNIKILNGRLFFHYNPKLCMHEIDQLANMSNLTNLTELEVQPESNGDKVACDIVNLNLTILERGSTHVNLSWNAYKPHDGQELINYVLSYTPSDDMNMTYEGKACGRNPWQIVDVGVSPSDSSPFLFKNIIGLTPYTSYAIFVKALTTRKRNKNVLFSPTGQSKMMLFRTETDIPTVVVRLMARPISHSEVVLTWGEPEQPNGPIAYYIVKGRINYMDDNILALRNYCDYPITPDNDHDYRSGPDIKYTILADDPDFCCNFQQSIKKPFEIFCSENALDITLGYKTSAKMKYCNAPSSANESRISNDTQLKIVDDNYGSFIYNVTGTRSLNKLKLQRLRHYSQYTISVSACGPMILNDIVMCSASSYINLRTLKKNNSDIITNVEVDVKNNTLTVISWDHATEPNGLITSHIIEYTNLIVEDAGKTTICVPATNNRKKRTAHALPNLSPGKYRIQGRAISLAGEGVWSEPIEFSVGLNEDYTVVIITSVIVIVFVIVCVGGYFYYRHCQKVKDRERLIASVNPDYIETKYVKDNWEVPRENLEVIEKLGLGNFGMVYRGILNGTTPVAVKTLSHDYTEFEKNDFLNEASVMKTFSTYHIVQLLGVVSEGKPPYVIMELMEFGDLKTYLRKVRDTDASPNMPRIIRMAGEIADGMAYLESRKFIHRDLAARNCMVSKDLVCKIGDFGMARDIYETDYYKIGQNGLLPIRWMAPENLSDGIFTPDSDVWSFGVVLYEILTMGELPYQGFSNDEVLNYVLRKGTVVVARDCPEILVKLMEKCFKWRPNDRPTFIEIVAELEPFLAQDFCEKSFYHSEEGVQIRNSGVKKPYHHPAQIRFHWGTETARWVREFEDNVTLLDHTKAGFSRGKIFKNGFQHLGTSAAMEDVPLDR